jgi:hypothetical protein
MGFSAGLFMPSHAVVRAAAAQVAVQRCAHFVVAWRLILLKQSGGRDRDAAHAVAALRRLLGNQRALHRMQRSVAAQAFDGGDFLVRDRP